MRRSTMFLVLLVVLGIMASGCASVESRSDAPNSSSSADDGKSAESSPASADPGLSGTEDEPIPRGAAGENDYARFKVLNVRLEDKRLNPHVPGPDGIYVIVVLSVKNLAEDAIEVDYQQMVAIAGEDQVAATDDGWQLDDAMSYEKVRPGLKIERSVTFDVKPKNARDAVMMVEMDGHEDQPVFLSISP